MADSETSGQVFTLPLSARDVVETGRAVIENPDAIPSLPVVLVKVDRFMQRVPWWVVALGAAGLMWYAGPRRKTS